MRALGPTRGAALALLVALAACSTYRRGMACARDGDTLVLDGGYPVEVDVDAKCKRVGKEPVMLDLDVTYWCEWTNDWDEDEPTKNGCSNTGATYVRVGDTTCFEVGAWCTDYPPLVDDDPVNTASDASGSFCYQALDLPLCDD